MALVATFSPAGWVTNPLEVIDFMLAYFFETQKSQTHFHKEWVTSYQSLIGDNGVDEGLGASIEQALGDYLKTEFTNVQIEVQVGPIDGESGNNEQTITIGCSFNVDEKRYQLSHAIELLGTQVKRIFRLDETGKLT